MTMEDGHSDISQEASVQESAFGVEDLMTLLHDLVYILGTVALVFVFFFRVVTVDGDSMCPTLRDRDKVLLLSSIWYGDPQTGDIVVARIPAFSSEPIVKRVIAVGGDVVDIDFDTGQVFVNGQVLEEAYIPEPTRRDFGQQGTDFPLTVEPGCVFLMGDNRNESYDSRFEKIGQVDERNILGRVIFLMIPGSDWSRIGTID